MPETGVSVALARARAAAIQTVVYTLELTLPSTLDEPVLGRVDVEFTVTERVEVTLDVVAAALCIHTVEVDGLSESPTLAGDHLRLSDRCSTPGRHVVRVTFTTDGAGLHRRKDHLYSLFVPARARSVFPCFDQPDLKGRLALTLDMPADWEAVANTPARSATQLGERRRVGFEPTCPLPTYLFAFAAGQFASTHGESRRVGRVFHRASERTAVARAARTICHLHDDALAWMEDYTGIAHPFGKLDIVLLPDFPFAGMEHPGAIFYNAASQVLESSATPERRLARARTIAHEVAHLWFGDLVTMTWFDDVWLKEVCAELMASKVAASSGRLPDDDLLFLLQHHPQAYDVDRTAGANPIRQPLDNLEDAGQLYGPMIYMKAPILFRQLEQLCGDQVMREWLGRYLRRHACANASWPDLRALFADRPDLDMGRWSADWIDTAGRPTCHVVVRSEGGRIADAEVVVRDRAGLGRTWPQRLHVTLGWPTHCRVVPVDVGSARVPVPGVAGQPTPAFVLPDGSGRGYGLFQLDERSIDALLERVETLEPSTLRGVAWLTLWDNMLEHRVEPALLLKALVRALAMETHEHLVQRLLAWTVRLFWRFLSHAERALAVPSLEARLRNGLALASSSRARAMWFVSYRDVCCSAEGIAWLARVWEDTVPVPGLELSEEDLGSLAMHLAIRDLPDADDVVRRQLDRTSNPDARARLAFVAPAAARDPVTRGRAFDRLLDANNRRRESWVIESLTYLNHPLRQDDARRFLRPGLECLPEIQRTGDIFLPRRWTEALLSGHNTLAAAGIVRAHLAECDDLAERLRWVVLAASDELVRAAR